MTTQTEAERLADDLQEYVLPCAGSEHWDTLAEAAAELRRLVSFNNDLMDEVARLQKREWVGLTDGEMRALKQKSVDDGMTRIVTDFEYIRSIEAKLKEKNNG